MIFPINFSEERDLILQKVVNRAWVDVDTIKGELLPLKKSSSTNSDGIGLPYKNSAQLFTKRTLGFNMRIVDGTSKYLISDPQNWGTHWQAFLALVLMDDSVKVTRKQSGGKSPSGANLPAIDKAIVDSLPCYLIPDKGNIVVVTSGQTSITYMKMYCDMTDIKQNDIIDDLNSEVKYKVINVKQLTQVAYTYCYLQGGVI
ncbi:MAG: hypothetical protein K0Q53_77 [Massilibacillus sp.]|nr:hypothetical protein [Massilibacillus sp.]